MNKRLKEIQARKLEIRTALTDNTDLNLDEIQTELRNLETEEIELRSRADIANKINAGEIDAGEIEKPNQKENRNVDKFESMEYRNLFMNHVVRGEKIPAEYRSTTTADASTIIPTTILNKIIDKLTASGMILPLITRTSYKGGVSIPNSSVKPVAVWVGEGKGSDKQKKTTGSIVFAYHKLRCAVAISFEMDNVSLSAFEATVINNITEAMVIGVEQAIISGTGEGQPTGILATTPNADQLISIAKIDYKTLVSIEAALPIEYETGAVYCMTKKTFAEFDGMTDSNGQPIAKVNYGIAGKSERSLLGRPVILCNYLPSYSAANAGQAFAFIFKFDDYILNTNYEIGIKKYEDYETDDQVTKAIMLADGKVVDNGSLVVLKKPDAKPTA